jgi:hypothetical protein
MNEIEAAKKTSKGRAFRSVMKTPRLKNSRASAGARDLKHFRRLKWDELVVSGDFIANGNQGFEAWEGPGGFRADTFLKPIYRRKNRSR